MRNILIISFFTFFTLQSFAQQTLGQKIDQFGNPVSQEIDSLYNNRKEISISLDGKTHFTDYKIISYKNDTTYIDTTLTMQKDYILNYIRKDDFELMTFQNQGQTYTQLAHDFTQISSSLPKFGARAKYFNFKEIEAINYYEVPTPTTELMYRAGLEQGQSLDVLLTINTSPEFNLSIAYKGLRSLGKYQQSLSSHKLFSPTFNYHTKNKRYFARGHFAGHNFLNQENGGLTTESLENFESNDENFNDRGRLDVNYTAENKLMSKRYHLEHSFNIFKPKEKDSTKIEEKKHSNLKIGHHFSYETNHYLFDQDTQSDILGKTFDSNTSDKMGLRTTNNKLYLELDSHLILGELRIKASHYTFDHYFNGIVNLSNQTIEAQLKGSTISAGAEWNATVKNFNLKADVSSIFSGDLTGNHLMAAATYKKDSLFTVTAKISLTSKSPNFNFLHFQSNYVEYNWQNDLKNEEIRNLSFKFKADKWVNVDASITQIDNYSYFDTISKPQQATSKLNYLKVKMSKSITVGKFTLDNTIMYQNVLNGTNFFRVPELVTRNSLYYSDYLFKNKPLYLQTGVTFKYFTKYQMDAYNPLLSEFNLQDKTEIGNFPVLDFFVNFQVRRTRFFIKAENFTSSFTGRDYYSAPNYPYRDFVVRFGLVWDFFI